MWTSSRNSAWIAAAVLAFLLAAAVRADPESLRALLELQDASGAWTSALPCRTTAAALIALAFNEGTPDTTRAADRGHAWLAQAMDGHGCWAEPGTAEAFIDQGLATWALALHARRRGDPGTAAALRRASAAIVRHQQKDGGWAATLGSTSKPERPVTALMMRALAESEKALGEERSIHASLQRASKHLQAYVDPTTGALDGPAATWCAVNAWQAIGLADDPAVRRAAFTAQQAWDEWPRHCAYPLLLALLAHQAATAYQPWPAREWATHIRGELARQRQPNGGWPASPVESAAGAAYATAMALAHDALARQALSTGPAGSDRDDWVWTFGTTERFWTLVGVVPLRDEDILSIPPLVVARLCGAAELWTAADEVETLVRLQESVLGHPPACVGSLLAMERHQALQRWSLESNWRIHLAPGAYPTRPLLRPDFFAEQVAATLATLPDESGLAQASQLIFEHSAQSWRDRNAEAAIRHPLDYLPPTWAAAWVAHRHVIVDALLRALAARGSPPHRTVVCVPAWYLLGDGGLLDELGKRGITPLTHTVLPGEAGGHPTDPAR